MTFCPLSCRKLLRSIARNHTPSCYLQVFEVHLMHIIGFRGTAMSPFTVWAISLAECPFTLIHPEGSDYNVDSDAGTSARRGVAKLGKQRLLTLLMLRECALLFSCSKSMWTRPAISLPLDQFLLFQFPTHFPAHRLFQLDILLDATDQVLPWFSSPILCTFLLTFCSSTRSSIRSTNEYRCPIK
jgi:hypothetical protein